MNACTWSDQIRLSWSSNSRIKIHLWGFFHFIQSVWCSLPTGMSIFRLPWDVRRSIDNEDTSYKALRGRSLFCCLLSQLVMSLLDKSPRHETCSSISVRKAQTAVKVTIETAILKTSTPPHSLFLVYCYLLCFLLVGLIRYLIRFYSVFYSVIY